VLDSELGVSAAPGVSGAEVPGASGVVVSFGAPAGSAGATIGAGLVGGVAAVEIADPPRARAARAPTPNPIFLICLIMYCLLWFVGRQW
jgi:hypothetical protein